MALRRKSVGEKLDDAAERKRQREMDETERAQEREAAREWDAMQRIARRIAEDRKPYRG